MDSINDLDEQILEVSLSILEEVEEDASQTQKVQENQEILGDYKDLEWEEWLRLFKAEAGKKNRELEVDTEGNSLVDFMDHEPLKRAFRDRVDPKSLAKDFASQFDIRSFNR